MIGGPKHQEAIMAEDQLTVATFLSPAEAEVIRARLDEEGIPSIIVGDDAETYPGMTEFEQGIRLRVPSEKAEQAKAILEEVRREVRAEAAAKGVPLTEAGPP